MCLFYFCVLYMFIYLCVCVFFMYAIGTGKFLDEHHLEITPSAPNDESHHHCMNIEYIYMYLYICIKI